MSAEGKKKRGISGNENAKHIPFRYGGAKCNMSTAIGRTMHPRGAGSRLVQAMVMGSVIGGCAKSVLSDRLINMTQEAMANCTHPALV